MEKSSKSSGAKFLLGILTATARMKKRRTSGGSVTGGTGDIKPQYLTVAVTAGAVDDYAVFAAAMPILRPQSSVDEATVVELLSCEYYLGVSNYGDNTSIDFAFLTGNTERSSADTSTLASYGQDVTRPQTFGAVLRARGLSTSGAQVWQDPVIYNFTDDNGNGMLFAGDLLNLVYGNVGGATAGECIAKVKYRFTRVPLIEFIGLVQQQQQS